MLLAYEPLFHAIVTSATDPSRTRRDRYRPFAIDPEIGGLQPRRTAVVARAARRVIGMIAAFPLGIGDLTRRRRISTTPCCEPACC